MNIDNVEGIGPGPLHDRAGESTHILSQQWRGHIDTQPERQAPGQLAIFYRRNQVQILVLGGKSLQHAVTLDRVSRQWQVRPMFFDRCINTETSDTPLVIRCNGPPGQLDHLQQPRPVGSL